MGRPFKGKESPLPLQAIQDSQADDGVKKFCSTEVSGTFGKSLDKNSRLLKAYDNC